MVILERQLVQREFDGKWESIVKVEDHENSYTYYNENGVSSVLTPTKWITEKVYDFLISIDD